MKSENETKTHSLVYVYKNDDGIEMKRKCRNVSVTFGEISNEQKNKLKICDSLYDFTYYSYNYDIEKGVWSYDLQLLSKGEKIEINKNQIYELYIEKENYSEENVIKENHMIKHIIKGHIVGVAGTNELNEKIRVVIEC